MADTRTLYNQWAHSYDTVENKTRDLERQVMQEVLATLPFTRVLEWGCGTGKNTGWLAARARVLAVDFSEGMLAKASEKIVLPQVKFQQADITRPWPFQHFTPDLITCSLMLEHIENLSFVFREAADLLPPGGYFYLCELHPYKQYSGSKARFETGQGLQVLPCFVHHVSDYVAAAEQAGFSCTSLREWFDEDDRRQPPRLLSLLLEK